MPTVVDCPCCGRKLRVPDELLGQRVKCPTCGGEFTAGAEAVAAPPAADLAPGNPSVPPTLDASMLRPDGPPRFEPQGFDAVGERRHLRLEAHQAIAGPAIALLVVGILGALGSGLVVCAGLIVRAAGNPRNPGGANEEIANFLAIGFYVLMLLVSVLLIACSVRMRRLDSYAAALTAGILACIPCLSPCFILGIPFGIWALVVVNQQNVREAFRG